MSTPPDNRHGADIDRNDDAALHDDEALVVVVDPEQDLVLLAGLDITELGDAIVGRPEPVSQPVLERFLRASSYTLTAKAMRTAADGSLVRLAPETMAKIKQGHRLAESGGQALGVTKAPGSHALSGPVRLLRVPVDPVTTAMLVSNMLVQRQLAQISEALVVIDRKIEALGEAHRAEVRAGVQAMAKPIDEMSRKLRAGHALTAEDENQLRDLETALRTRGNQARLWIDQLERLAGSEPIALAEQHDALQRSLKDHHVAFWVAVALSSDILRARVLKLRAERVAAVEDPVWAAQLTEQVTTEIEEMVRSLHGMHTTMDTYLRQPEIARGLEELQFKRKRQVQRFRVELHAVASGLHEGLVEMRPQLRDIVGEELPPLADALERPAKDRGLPAALRGAVGRAAELTSDAAGHAAGTAVDLGKRGGNRMSGAVDRARRRGPDEPDGEDPDSDA